MSMTIENIYSLLDNPATILNALEAAAALPFQGSDSSLFNQKRQKYSAGMTDYERLQWVQEMKVLLLPYKQHFGTYKADALKRWHHLDKKELKRHFDKFRRSIGNVKVLFVEKDNDPLSFELHEIICSYLRSLKYAITEVKGDIERYLDCEDGDTIENQWIEFMRFAFDLSVSAHVADEFKRNGYDRQIHVVVQAIDSFHEAHFLAYCALWQSLPLQQPLFLFFYTKEQVLPQAIDGLNFLCCSYKQEQVHGEDFSPFFAKHTCYTEDLALCHCCQPMSFREALEKLQFCEQEH